MRVCVGAVLAIAMAVPMSAAPAFAQSYVPTPGLPADCSLLEDPERERPSWLRFIHWSVFSGRGADGRPTGSLSAGVSLLTRERLCQLEPFFESRLTYKRTVLALRGDVDLHRRFRDPNYRLALEASSGSNAWGWLQAAVAAGPVFGDGDVDLGLSASTTAAGIRFEVRWQVDVASEEYDVLVLVGLSNLHLAGRWLFE